MGLTVVDQGASSVSNFALALVVAHYSSASALGVFAILSTTYVVAQGLVRSLTSDCLLTRAEGDDALMRNYEHGGYLAALVLSASLGALILAVSGALPEAFTLPFAVFAISFPLMAAQDYARYIGISRYEPGYAIRLDVAWLVLFLVLYEVLRHTGHVTLPWLFGAWSGAGALVGLYTFRAHWARSRRRVLLAFWVRSERAVGVRFAGQFMLATSWTYMIFYLLVLVISIAGIGEIKLAQLALGPVTVMAAGLQSALIALAAERFQRVTRDAMRLLVLGGLIMAGATVVWSVAVYVTPVHAMTSVLGPTWPAARPLVPFMGLSFTFSGFAGAATAGLRAMRAARENMRLALVMLPFLLLFFMGGAVLFGTQGATGGLAASMGMYAVLAWWLLIRTSRRFVPGTDHVVEDPVVEMAEP
jgi:O-antigen/teichoic acid export membrane protein